MTHSDNLNTDIFTVKLGETGDLILVTSQVLINILDGKHDSKTNVSDQALTL